MATRATYEFQTAEGTTTIYVHWDGYEEGAAAYFANMLDNGGKGNLPTRFIRANEQAELTGHGRDYHGDTEYHYVITEHAGGPAVQWFKRGPLDETWRYVLSLPIEQFLNRYSEQLDGRRYISFAGAVVSIETLERQAVEKIEQAEQWQERGQTGNSSSAADEAWRKIQALPGDRQELQNRIFALDKVHAHKYGWTNPFQWFEQFRPEAEREEYAAFC